MCDSGPNLSHKLLLGQLATCVLIEGCVFQLSTHAKMHLGLPDMKQKIFNKILNDSKVEAWQILGQDSSASCGCASD